MTIVPPIGDQEALCPCVQRLGIQIRQVDVAVIYPGENGIPCSHTTGCPKLSAGLLEQAQRFKFRQRIVIPLHDNCVFRQLRNQIRIFLDNISPKLDFGSAALLRSFDHPQNMGKKYLSLPLIFHCFLGVTRSQVIGFIHVDVDRFAGKPRQHLGKLVFQEGINPFAARSQRKQIRILRQVAVTGRSQYPVHMGVGLDTRLQLHKMLPADCVQFPDFFFGVRTRQCSQQRMIVQCQLIFAI